MENVTGLSDKLVLASLVDVRNHSIRAFGAGMPVLCKLGGQGGHAMRLLWSRDLWGSRPDDGGALSQDSHAAPTRKLQRGLPVCTSHGLGEADVIAWMT